MVSDNRLRVKPIMLPYSHIADSYESIKLLYREQISSYEYGRDGRVTQILIGKMGYLPQHLYFVSDREIQGYNWVIATDTNTIFKMTCSDIEGAILAKSLHLYKVIEATTDSSLGLVSIPYSFIEEYVDHQGKVDYLYISSNVKAYKDHTEVIIIPVKESYNKEELKKAVLAGFYTGVAHVAEDYPSTLTKYDREYFEQYFNENY